MIEALIAQAGLWQAAVLGIAFVTVLAWESLRAALPSEPATSERPRANFGLLLINHGLGYALVPAAAGVAAFLAPWPALGAAARWQLPWWAWAMVCLVVLDLVAWGWHVAQHRIDWLWRVHRVHHSDATFDAALAFRFHPLEVAGLALLSAAVVALLGLPTEGVVLAGLVAVAHNVFSHANARLPSGVERALRRVIITPDVHRLHHHDRRDDANSNYGIVFPLWDRLAGFWREPTASERETFGVSELPGAGRAGLVGALLMPLRGR